MRKILRIMMCIVGIILMGCFGEKIVRSGMAIKLEEVEPEFVLSYGEVNLEENIMAKTAYYFAERVKELSGGKVLIEIYPSGQLGDDAKCYQAMAMGALDLYRGNSASLIGNGTSMISVMALPYLFQDREHFWNVCNSKLGTRILDDIQKCSEGMRGLAFVDEGARRIFTTDKEIRKLEDLEGLAIRIPVSDIMIDTISALGATPIPVEYVELYSMLKAKNIDGAENPPISYYYNKFYEVASYYVKDPHTYAPGVILISEMTWDNLGETYQDVIKEAANLTQHYNSKVIKEAEEEVYREMERMGVVITELLDVEAWRAAVESVYQKYGIPFLDIIEQIKNMSVY